MVPASVLDAYFHSIILATVVLWFYFICLTGLLKNYDVQPYLGGASRKTDFNHPSSPIPRNRFFHRAISSALLSLYLFILSLVYLYLLFYFIFYFINYYLYFILSLIRDILYNNNCNFGTCYYSWSNDIYIRCLYIWHDFFTKGMGESIWFFDIIQAWVLIL